MRTICVVTIRINIANMVAIATLIDIREQKRIVKTLLDREKNIRFLSFNGKSYFYLWETLFHYLLGQIQ